MSEKRRNTKALKEIEETKILVDFLLHHGLSFNLLENFSDAKVKIAVEWNNNRL